MKMQYYKKSCKEFENSQTKSAMRIIIRMIRKTMMLMNMWATRMVIMVALQQTAQHINEGHEHSTS